MIPNPLPFEVLGQLGPILAWVEGEHGSRLPSTWTTEAVRTKDRERGWLLSELPTYSYDNVDDIARGARSEHHGPRPMARPFPWEPSRRTLSPPVGYDLIEVFRSLNEYFFSWKGSEPSIREGRMEELHELGIRIPAGHVVRHAHARAVSEGVLSFEKALELPELVTLLPSNAFGLRSVIRKGLSESHLHLTAVTSAEETWADNLLKPLYSRAIQADTPEERRLLVLNLFAGRLLALAVWVSFRGEDEPLPCEPQALLRLLDAIYFARSPAEERLATFHLEKKIRRAVYGPIKEEAERALRKLGQGQRDKPWTRYCCEQALLNRPVLAVHRWRQVLLRWVAPTALRLGALSVGGVLPGGAPEGLRDRYRYVHQLHLAAHLRLIQLSPQWHPGPAPPKDRLRPSDWRRSFLHEALFRYLVCRTHHWQLAVQQGRTTGLRHFRESYYTSKHRRPKGLTDLQYAELVFERLRQWRGLRVLEGRVSPPKDAGELVPWILAHARADDRRIQKFGVVVHFIKEDECKEERPFPGGAPPVPRLRWGKRRRMIRGEGMRLYRLLRRPTPVTPFIVGIDAANLELSTPPEVFAPVFRFLRDLPIRLSDSRRHHSPFLGIDPAIRSLVANRRLGMTYHVGEDFRHLLSGLRAIYEVVDFLGPTPGDRLGHGTALALDPKDWLENNGYQAVMPRLEWLDTLVWVHHFLGPGDKLVGELAIEDKIQRLSWEVYREDFAADYDPLGISPDAENEKPEKENHRPRRSLDPDWSPLTLWDAWTLRQLDPYEIKLRELFLGKLEMHPPRSFCEESQRWHGVQERRKWEVDRAVGSRNAYLLLALYWLSPRVRKLGDELVVVDMKEQRPLWLELCRRVEEKMRRLIHRRELVVEVNPSSNRIIGPMDRYGQHHAFHLTFDKEKQRLKRQVRVSVNTDNPAVCNTTLAHEHYLLGEILIKDGVAEAEVVNWLEWLRANGEEYNFVRRLRSADEDPDMGRLIAWLRSIRTTVREARTRSGKLEAFWRWQRETRLRDQGFTQEAITAAPFALERLVALESQLAEWRRLAAEGSPPPGLEERLARVEEELAEARRWLGMR